MKPTQTAVLLFILVLMVFGVTFVLMYAPPAPPGTPKDSEELPSSNLRLRFPVVHEPRVPIPREQVIGEHAQPGHRDFWFVNDNDKTVTVGLNSKNCTCTAVRLFVAPAGWRKQLAMLEAPRAALGVYSPLLPALSTLVAGAGQVDLADQARLKMTTAIPEGDMTELLKETSEGTPVPARAIGFVRLGWDGRKMGQQTFSAKLWSQDPQAPTQALSVSALVLDPVRLDTEDVDLGLLEPGGRAEGILRCWSSTRPNLKVEVKSNGEPFITCKTEPLTDEDRRRAETAGLPVVAGYRIRILVRERIEESKRIDEGVFYREIRVSATDGGQPLGENVIKVRGVVRGDVSLAGGGAGIYLGTFSSERGKRAEVILQSDRPGLELAVKSFPKFMEKPVLEKTDGHHWRLRVEIRPRAAEGNFPRADTTQYQNTLISLEIKGGAHARLLQIPVRGNATK
jgi:hypothetical protein